MVGGAGGCGFMVGVADLDGSLVTAEVVIDDGEVTAGGMIDTKDPLNDVPPQTSVPLSCTHTLTPSLHTRQLT